MNRREPGPDVVRGVGPAARPGRPPTTTAAQIQRAAIALFARQGYAETSVDDIAAALGIGRTTFFRYFRTKSSVIWHDLENIRRLLVETLAQDGSGRPAMDVIREATLAAINYDDGDRNFVRTRNELIGAAPELYAEGAGASARWAQAIASWVGTRLGADANPTLPDAIGYAVLGSVSSALQIWSGSTDLALPVVLRASFDAITPPLQAAIDATFDAGDAL